MPVERVVLTDLSPDLPGYGARNGASRVNNLLPLDGRLRCVKKLAEEAQIATASTNVFEPIIGTLYYPGRSSLFYGSTSALGNQTLGSGSAHLYEVTLGATHAITHRSKATGYAGGIYDWSFALFDDVLVAASIGNAVQFINTTATAFNNLIATFDGVTPPQAKYCCVGKTHLVLAHIRHDGVIYPRRVWWSAAGDATDFAVSSTTRSGYYEVPSAAGEITGCVGYEDFFLLFTESKVIRFNWIGGAEVWFPQELAGGSGFGMDPFSSRSIVRVGTDTIYRSREGYKVIGGNGGLGSFTAGKVASIVRDPPFPTPGTYGTLQTGAADDVSGLLTFLGSFGLSDQELGVVLVANPAEGRFTVFDTGVGLPQISPFPANAILQAYAPPNIKADGDGLENMVIIWNDTTNAKHVVYRFKSATLAAFTLASRLIEPVPGSASEIRRVRPVIELESGAKTNHPVATITISYYSDAWGKTTSGSAALDTATDTDAEGWLLGPLPIVGQRVEFTLSVAEIDTSNTYVPVDVVGVDADFDHFSEK